MAAQLFCLSIVTDAIIAAGGITVRRSLFPPFGSIID
jgi:hypothetical protein